MGHKRCWQISSLLLLAGVAPISADTGSSPLRPTRIRHRHEVAKSLLARALQGEGHHLLPSVLSRSSPSLLASTSRRTSFHANDARDTALALPVSAVQRMAKIPPLLLSKLREQKPPANVGFYYGLMPETIFPYDSAKHRAEDQEKAQQLAMVNTLTETLEEMKSMRQELQSLRREMYEMRKKITGEQDLEFEGGLRAKEIDPKQAAILAQKRQREFDRLGREVEKWARRLLFEEERCGKGWTEVTCNRKVVGRNVNADGSTTCYMTYFPDARGKNAFVDDDKDYPCIKIYGVVDAPLEDVCTYLSIREHMTDYNGVLSEQRDLEEISPHSKITLASSPQVLFVKPRDFVTFVHHRWLNDGSVVMINQAVEHKDAPGIKEEGKGKVCRGYALRGATFISPDPQDPGKTRMSMIAHAAPGGSLPQWAVKTAMGAVTPIEPFKLYHYINENVQKFKPELEKLKLARAEQVSTPGRSNQPVGIAQIGFAAFWPKGGGLMPMARPKALVTESQEDGASSPGAETAAGTPAAPEGAELENVSD